jgi:ring-1,2-phenylacetyl-CoA epoxidase subunit PaaE
MCVKHDRLVYSRLVNSLQVLTTEGEHKTLSVEAGVSLLDAVEQAGLDAPHSCRTGLCTECAAMVTAGMENVLLEAAVLDPEVYITTSNSYEVHF